MILDVRHPLRLFLVRHGQVEANREFRYVGSVDQPLTELGVRQAEAVGTALRELEIDRVLSSPLVRARRTAECIAAGLELDVCVEDRLREQSFGAWEGLSRDEVLARDGERLRLWEADPEVPPPEGESQVAVQRRVLDLIGELAAVPHGDSPRGVALVSHVGPIKAVLAAALDISLLSARRLFLDPASVSVVDWGDPPLVRLCNSHAHLGWTNARWMHR